LNQFTDRDNQQKIRDGAGFRLHLFILTECGLRSTDRSLQNNIATIRTVGSARRAINSLIEKGTIIRVGSDKTGKWIQK